MTRSLAGSEIEQLIKLLARLPGFGSRSARRAGLYLIKKKESLLIPLAKALEAAAEQVCSCSICGNVDTCNPCTVCCDQKRDKSTIIVVEDVSDLWALERSRALNALYHVLGGTLSPLDGIGPDNLNITSLIDRVYLKSLPAYPAPEINNDVSIHVNKEAENNICQGSISKTSQIQEIREVIIAVNATIEGQSTAHYITEQLADSGVKVSRLAHGVPVGGELDYLDEGTLVAAIRSRTAF